MSALPAVASPPTVSGPNATFGMALQSPDPKAPEEIEFELNRGAAVDILLADYPTILSRCCDFSIFHRKVLLEDSQGFHIEGLRAYKTFFTIVPTLINFCCSRSETSAILMDKYALDKGRIKIRWRMDLFPRFTGNLFRLLDTNGDGVISTSEYRNSQKNLISPSASSRGEPVVIEGISIYKLNRKGEITEHKIEVTNPSSASPLAILQELLPVRRYATAPNAIGGIDSPAPTVLSMDAASVHPESALQATQKDEGAGVLASGKKWAKKNLPKTCKEDYDCNPGGYNWPLRCVDVIVAKICIDPDDWKGGGLGAHNLRPEDLVKEPIPVRVEDGWLR